MQAKLGTWMQDMNSCQWSVGQHCTMGDVLYHLMFDQSPCVEISSLHLDSSLLDTLAAETELNQLVDLQPPDELNKNVLQGDSDGDYLTTWKEIRR